MWRLTFFALPVCFQGVSTNRRATGSGIENCVSHRLTCSPFCDDTNRATGLRGWLTSRVASGAVATSCSYSRFERKTGKLSPILPRHFRSQRRVHVFVTWISLEGAAGSVRPPNGVSSVVAHFRLRSLQFCCFSVALFSFLAFRCCSGRSSSVDSASARCRWAWRVTTRWRARPPLMLTSQKVSEPHLHWRKAQMGSGLVPFGCSERSLIVFLGLAIQTLDDGMRECGCVWVFGCRRSDTAIPSTSPPLPLQEKVARILRHQQRSGPAWSHSDTRDLSTAVLKPLRSRLSARWWDPGERRSEHRH